MISLFQPFVVYYEEYLGKIWCLEKTSYNVILLIAKSHDILSSN